MTTRFKEQVCLDCGYIVDAAASVSLPHIPPREGDVTICFRCQHIMVYADSNGALRHPTDKEMVEMAGDPELVHAQNNLAAYWKREKEKQK